MTFGERLKELRIENGLKQVEASELIGVSHGCWGHWEKGRYFPKRKYMERIANEFGVELKWLESGLGEKTVEEVQKKVEEAEARKRDESRVVYSKETEEQLRDIEIVIRSIKELDVPKERKRHIHRTLSGYRTELENAVLFGEIR